MFAPITTFNLLVSIILTLLIILFFIDRFIQFLEYRMNWLDLNFNLYQNNSKDQADYLKKELSELYLYVDDTFQFIKRKKKVNSLLTDWGNLIDKWSITFKQYQSVCRDNTFKCLLSDKYKEEFDKIKFE